MADTYNVQRATTEAGPWTTIATGVTGTTYTDNSLSASTTRSYRVFAVNASGTSAASNIATATTDAAGFTFAGLGNLEADWNADSISQADATVVTSLADSSGNSHTATKPAGSSGSQPVIKNALAAFNGHNAIRFGTGGAAAIGDNLATAAFTIAQPTTIFIVFKLAATSTGVMFDGSTNITHDIRTNGSAFQAYAGGAITIGTPDTNLHILVVQFNGASSKIWLDGGVSATGNAGSDGIGGIVLGASPGGSNVVSGDISRWLFYSAAKNLTDINAAGTQLASLYGATWNTAT